VTIRTIDPPPRLYLSGVIILRGEGAAVRKIIDMVKEAAARDDVKVIFATVSSRRLWVKQEGVEP